MRIETVEAFYLAMPEIRDIGDGSQDMALIRVRSDDGTTGWGECEASPLPTIAALVTPPSHSACHGVLDSVLGARIDQPADIAALAGVVAERGLDLLQTAHAWSGVEIALWDLLGRASGEPVWALLGHRASHARLPYASQLFGDTPEETLAKARQVAAEGYRAAKFGWGPFGRGSVAADWRPRAPGAAATSRCWWIPAPSGVRTWTRPPPGYPPSKPSARSGWRSPSCPERWLPTPGSRTGAGRSGWQPERAPTMLRSRRT